MEVRVPCHGLVVLATQSAFCHGLFIVEVVVVPRAVLLALFWRHVKWLVSHEDMNIPPTDSQILMQTARSHNTPTPLPFPLLPPAARTPVPTHQPHAAPHNSNTKGAMIYFASLVHRRHSQLALCPIGVLLFCNVSPLCCAV